MARNAFQKHADDLCVCLIVWVLFVNSIVCLFVFLCLFFVFECFWLGLLAERFCLVGFSGL